MRKMFRWTGALRQSTPCVCDGRVAAAPFRTKGALKTYFFERKNTYVSKILVLCIYHRGMSVASFAH